MDRDGWNPRAANRRHPPEQRHQAEYREQQIVPARNPPDGLHVDRMYREHQRCGQRGRSGRPPGKGERQQQAGGGRVEHDVRDVVRPRARAAARRVDHERRDRDGTVIRFLRRDLAFDLEVAARERTWHVPQIREQCLVPDDQVGVVGANEVEANRPRMNDQGESAGEEKREGAAHVSKKKAGPKAGPELTN